MIRTLISKKINTYNTREKVKGSGEVFTPFKRIEQMLNYFPDKVWSDHTKTWFDNCAGLGNFHCVVLERLMVGLKEWQPDNKKRYKHIVENQLFFIEMNSESCKLIEKYFNPNNLYRLNIKCGDSMKVSFASERNASKFFNLEYTNSRPLNNGIMNPPYTNNVYIKFLDKMWETVNEKIVSVQPATFLLEKKGIFANYESLKRKLHGHVESVYLFNGNKDFGIALWLPCSIIVIDKTKTFDKIIVTDEIKGTTEEYNSIDDINQYGNIPEYFSLKEKIIKRSSRGQNIWKVFKMKPMPSLDERFVLPFTALRGNVVVDDDESVSKTMVKDDYYTIVSSKKKILDIDEYNNLDTNKNLSRKFWIQYFFKTRSEGENFLLYLKQKISRFVVSIYKVNQHLDSGELSLLPYLDFTKKWTDVELKREFEITDREYEFIDSVIPDYY